MVKDWIYEHKGRAHGEFGEVFLVVSLEGVICYVANSKTVNNVCTGRKDFMKSPEKMSNWSHLLWYFQAIFLIPNSEPFGPNVVSTDSDLWRFHLRITATPLGEEVNSLVWSDTSRQTKLLVASWSSGRSSGLKMDV